MHARICCGLIVLALISSCLIGCSLPAVAGGDPPQPTPVPGTILLGIYYGNQGWQIDQVRQVEQWQNKRFAIVNMFTNWCDRADALSNLFDQQLLNIWNNGNVPLITWEPFLCSPDQTPPDVEVKAAAGAYDAYVGTWADRLKVFLSGPDGTYATSDDRRAFLRMGHEMNGDWYPWSAMQGRNDPADYVAMWTRVHGIFDTRDLDATHLQWIWAVNNDDVGRFRAEQYYPGDQYVDWIGIDGFNWGSSQSWSQWRLPGESFDGMLKRLRTLSTKPIALPELATSSSMATGNDVTAKSQWIRGLYTYAAISDIRMVAWFNEDKETDWAVVGGANGDETLEDGGTSHKAYSAYKTAVRGHDFVASDPDNLRLLTEAQFAGR